ncbi:Scr1 family TA system antitoxin-like transcriptional regulator [Streptomyces sp. NPDC087850]|uniref:helix-turn-helix domain-containing protein n=1 Tax=unclassified Streptomyces TaxID=2593676 RepID=UPI003827F3E6
MELDNEEEKVTPRTVLGRALRRERELVNLSLRALADELGYPHSYISRVEHGKQLPSDGMAEALDTRFGTSKLFVDLLKMVQDASMPDYGPEFLRKEQKAIRIEVFNTSVFPGLLQTERYAREMFQAGIPGESDEKIEARVAIRTKRQSILEREEPPFYWAIIDEAVLARPMANRALMREQLERLVQAVRNPHITVQVVPFSAGLHAMLGGSITLLTLEDGATIALLESFGSGEPVDSPKRIIELEQRFNLVRSKALPEDESLDLIRRYLKGYEDEKDS